MDNSLPVLLKNNSSVKDLLREAIDLTRISLDLAFYTFLSGDEELAREVLNIERTFHLLEFQIYAKTSLAVRDSEDAEKAISIHKLATSLNRIVDASGDLAKSLLNFKPRFPPYRGYSGEETIAKVEVGVDGTPKLEELLSSLKIIVNIVALRRDNRWILEPSSNIRLRGGDILILKGTLESINKFAKAVNAQTLKIEALREESSNILELFRIVDLMVMLALSALLMNDKWIARYVVDLEEVIDEYLQEFEKQVVSSTLGEREKASMLFAAFAAERISDASREIITPILEDLEPHPILLDVLMETKERIAIMEVGTDYDGKKLIDLDFTSRGIIVLAVRRGKHWFIMPPYTAFTLRDRDILIIKYYEESEKFLSEKK